MSETGKKRDVSVYEAGSTSNDGAEYELNCSESHKKLLDFRQQGELCDITLVIDGEHFKCHKLILASWSPYFQSMFLGNFAEKDQTVVHLKSVTKIGFKAILDCIYTRKIILHDDTVSEVFQSAHFLNVQPVMDKCLEYMIDNPKVQYLSLAITYQNGALKDKIVCFIKSEFSDLVDCEDSIKDFADITKTEIVSILGSYKLKTHSEYQVFQVLEVWINNNKCTTDEKLELMKLVRVHLLSTREWDKLIRSSLSSDYNVMQYFLNLMTYYVNPVLRPIKTQGVSNIPRSTPTILTIGGNKGASEEDTDAKTVHGTYIKYKKHDLAANVGCFDLDQDMILQDNESELTVDMPNPVSMAQAVVINNFLYVLGGIIDRVHGTVKTSSKVFRFCPVDDTWLEIGKMPRARMNFTAAGTNTAIYVFGGYSSKSKSRQNKITAVDKYDIQSDRWNKVTNLALPDSAKAASLNDTVYIFFDKSIHIWNEASGECTPLITTEQMNSKHSVLLSCKNFLYVANLSRVERINPDNKSIEIVMERESTSRKTVTAGCCVNIYDNQGKAEPRLQGIALQVKHCHIYWLRILDSGHFTLSDCARPDNVFSALACLTLVPNVEDDEVNDNDGEDSS